MIEIEKMTSFKNPSSGPGVDISTVSRSISVDPMEFQSKKKIEGRSMFGQKEFTMPAKIPTDDVFGKSLEKAKLVKFQFDNTIENLDHSIKDVVERNNFLLNFKYMPKIEETKKEKTRLLSKVRAAERSQNKDKYIAILTEKLSDYKGMSDSLRKKSSQLEIQLQSEKSTQRIINLKLKEAKDELQTINRENMELFATIEQLQLKLSQQDKEFFLTGVNNAEKMSPKKIGEFKKNFESDLREKYLKYPEVNMKRLTKTQKKIIEGYQEDIDYLYKVIQEEKLLMDQKREENYNRLAEVIECSQFFSDCLATSEKQFFKEQELETSKESGMAGSLFFELKRKKIDFSQLSELTNQEISRLSKTGEKSTLQDRHTMNVIYKAIRSIISTAKEQKKIEHMLSIKLEWEDFKKFKPIHIIGLLLLRKDILEQIKKEIFPKAIMHSTTDSRLQLKNISISQSKTAQDQHPMAISDESPEK